MTWIDEETKLGLIVDEIVGYEDDRFTYSYKEQGIKATIDDGQSITKEWMIETLAEHLKEMYPEHVQKNLWCPIRFTTESERSASMRSTVDTVIDGDPIRWMGRYGPYIYSEDDRRRIVQRCAEAIVKRLKKYEKRHKIQYKIFNNTGEVGFRYE